MAKEIRYVKTQGAKYLLEVHMTKREDATPAPSIWWEVKSKEDAFHKLLDIMLVYNQAGQAYYASYATIETIKGKQVYFQSLKDFYVK